MNNELIRMGSIRKLYDFYFIDGADQRVSGWPLMDGPGQTILICGVYVYFVKYLGPRLMKDRKPYDLKNVLIAYNAFQAAFSFWFFTECIRAGWFWDYSFRCQPIDYSYSPRALRTVGSCWWYLISKFVDQLDTVFFVLRKRSEHVSFLHVFHHAVMPFGIWYGVKFVPGGHSTFCGLMNSFVHTVMYTYYLLAALGPQYRKLLWWKKYLTIIQMAQFLLGMLHAGQLFFTECDFPRFYAWWSFVLGPTFFGLFYDFYAKAYRNASHRKVENPSPSSPDSCYGESRAKRDEAIRRKLVNNSSSERRT